MPSPYIKKLAKETGKTVAEVEELWQQAKEYTSENLGVEEKNFGSKEYSYTTDIVKRMVGKKKEELLDPSKFLDSDKWGEEYINETVVSGNFDIGSVSPPEEDEDEDVSEKDCEEEEDEEETEEKKKKYSSKKKKESFPLELPEESESEYNNVDDKFVENLDKMFKES